MVTLISVLTNQFFLIFLAIALGLLLGKVKIGNFSLGVSGGIFSGIVLGYIAQAWAKGVQEGALGYSSAANVLKTGVVSNLFFTFFFGFRFGKNSSRCFRMGSHFRLDLFRLQFLHQKIIRHIFHRCQIQLTGNSQIFYLGSFFFHT